jgi:DNA-binding MarR family transcriptional regulator
VSWYPDLAEDILKGLYEQIRPSLMLFVEAAGNLPDCDLILMQVAYCLEPSRLHQALLIESMPYTNPEIFIDCMNAAVSHGWLYQEGGKFGLTESGREIVEGLNELCDRLYAKITLLSDLEMARLRYLSDQVIEKIIQQPEPIKKPAFNLKLLFGHCLKRPLIVQLRQQMFIVLAFREDAHVAAWRPFESNGRLWETFTLICQGQAGDTVELVAQLPHRNYSTADYADALDSLDTRGWITLQDDRYIPTKQAVRIWNEVEERTDQIFAAAFSGLSNAKKEEFQRLMRKFSSVLRQVDSLSNN